MLYDSPCDEPGYFAREYPEEYARHLEARDEYEIDEYENRNFDDKEEILEVNWESPR